MKKQELEELRRLEEELMAAEYREEDSMDEIDLLEDTWQDLAELPVDVYNADDTDVDLDAFSEDVHRGKQRKSALPIVLIVLLSCAVVFYAMKILGVL